MMRVTLLERIVLECIINENCNKIETICFNLQQNKEVIDPILKSLIRKKFLSEDAGKYFPLHHESLFHKRVLQSHESKFLDSFEIFKKCFDKKIKKQDPKAFSLEHCYLDERDQKILDAILFNLKSFLESQKEKKSVLAKKKVFFLGQTTYQDLMAT
jgi:hypothetical protein